MSANQLKPGNRVLVSTKSLCQYEGFFQAINRSKGTFTLTKVRCLGSKDGHFSSSKKVYDCVEFVAKDVSNLLALDDGADGMRSDPAILSVNVGHAFDNYRGRRPSPSHNRRYSGPHYNPPFNRSRFQQRDVGRDYRSERSHQPFRGDRSPAPPRNFRKPQDNYWSQFQSRSPMQREGSFPQKFPGQQKTLGEYDIDKGLEEFSRLKLDGEDGDSTSGKGYNKEKSFFDSLTIDAGEKVKQPDLRRFSPGKAAQIDQNVLTFGEDTVRSLNFFRNTSFNQSHRGRGYHGGHRGYGARGFQPQRRFVPTGGNMRRNYYGSGDGLEIH